MGLRYSIKLKIFQTKWRKKNRHNSTIPVTIFDPDCVFIGRYTYGNLNALTYNKANKLIIGDFCSIAPEVVFLISADHRTDLVSTYPFRVRCLGEKQDEISKGNIIIENDVWIGFRCTILSGVKIGQGAVVAAGSIVTKDIPPYSIVAGVPARIVKYRFSSELINRMKEIDYNKLNLSNIKNNIDKLTTRVDDNYDFEYLNV